MVSSKDRISIPDNVKTYDLRIFLDSYFEMHQLILVDRGNRLVLAKLADFKARFLHDVKLAEIRSIAEVKPILIKVTSDFCGPCEIQTHLFFKEDKLYSELQNFILLEIDLPTLNPDEPKYDAGTRAFAESLKIPLDRAPVIVMKYGDRVKVMNTADLREITDWSFYWGNLVLFRREMLKRG